VDNEKANYVIDFFLKDMHSYLHFY